MTGMVENVIPNYGYGYGVGQLLPSSYAYNNLPYNYRGYFNDSDDYYYRYAPGAIYQVNRETALITAVAALLTGGLTVGQPLPIGYSAYNVPMAYRSNYYDTPDVMPTTPRATKRRCGRVTSCSARAPIPIPTGCPRSRRRWPSMEQRCTVRACARSKR